MSDTDLERQVAATLASHAGGLVVEPQPFEPIRPALDLGGGDPAGPPSPPLSPFSGRRRLVAAVAAAMVVVVGIAAVVARTGDGGADLELGAVPGVPEDAFIPAWDAPDGWELSSLDWDIVPTSLVDSMVVAGTVQLLGVPGDDGSLERALLVEINAGGPGEAPERTTVRGKPGQWGPDFRDPDATMLLWDEEQGLHMRASYRGMSTAEAVAVLDSLTVRPGGVEAGFDLPASGLPGGLAVLGEARATDPLHGPTAVLATFGTHVLEEAETLGTLGYKARVETVSPSGGHTPVYLTAWFVAGRGDDEVARWWSPPEDVAGGRLQNEGVLRTIRADGWAVEVTIDDDAVAADSLGAPEEVARAITESVAPATADRLTELWEGLVDQWAARELVVAVPTPVGTVELRGRRSETVLCLHDGEVLSCAAAQHPDANSSPAGQWMATVPTEAGDRLVAVSDKGPILMEIGSVDETGEVFTYVDAEEGEADRFWAAVVTVDAAQPWVQPITDVAREAEACLNMLGSGLNPEGAQPAEETRIRQEGGGPTAMYQACRELTGGSWHRDVGP